MHFARVAIQSLRRLYPNSSQSNRSSCVTLPYVVTKLILPTCMSKYNVNSIQNTILLRFYHDYQKKESFCRCFDSDMAFRNTVFHIGFGVITERAAKGTVRIRIVPQFVRGCVF